MASSPARTDATPAAVMQVVAAVACRARSPMMSRYSILPSPTIPPVVMAGLVHDGKETDP